MSRFETFDDVLREVAVVMYCGGDLVVTREERAQLQRACDEYAAECVILNRAPVPFPPVGVSVVVRP